ncbi:MAG: PKD domain-containing protein [Bacteroidota bacterium]|nr:PKD domain-containing protein [Bacteroidota bacterium]
MRLKFIFVLAVVCGLSFSTARAQQTAKITSSGIGYLEYLPQDYSKNSNEYPIVIFLHGIGEKGTTSTDPTTLKNSVQKVANVGLAKYVKYGQQYPFIVISPQLKSSYGSWPASYVMDVLNHVKKYLRVNDRKIYITGLSLGGYGTWTTLGAYPGVFAAAVPICSGGSALTKACAIASENIPLWAFHGTADNVVSYTVTTNMINAVNGCTPKPNPLAKTTLFSGLNHIIWDKVYKETNALDWMLSFTNGSTSGATNAAPTVSAGADKVITLPTNEIYLQGSASDSDGSIASYTWTKTSGGSGSLSGTNTSKLRAYNLAAGNYYFRLTVKDDKGATKSDDMMLTVRQGSTSNVAPVANAGSDRTTSSSSISLAGSGTDKDGQIVAYNWTQYGGNSTVMSNANTKTVTINGLKDGRYYFRLTVKDDKGATDYDNMMVTVSGSTNASSPAPNSAPIANAGSDRITSSSSITLNGSASDKDGNIASYRWTQYGGASTTMANANSLNVTISGLREGRYYFRLTVTDSKGASDYDNMMVTVTKSSSSASNIAPVSNAGSDKRVDPDAASIRLYGSGSDRDGRIVSYKWTQYGGSEDITLVNTNSSTVTVTDLAEGHYYLRLTVKDDDGAVDYDNMMLVVNES